MAANQSEESLSHSENGSNNMFDDIRYDPEEGVYRTQVEMTSDVSLCVEVVWAISEITGKEPVAMEALTSVIDPDAFEKILTTDDIGDVQVTFTYEGWSVTVAGDGEITLSEAGVR